MSGNQKKEDNFLQVSYIGRPLMDSVSQICSGYMQIPDTQPSECLQALM